MPVTDSFVAFVLEQLEPLGPVTPKKMFGAVGLYAGDQFFGLISKDVLYLKADESTRAAMKKAGSRPFRPFPGRPPSTHHFSVPVGVLEDSDALLAWAKNAVAVASRGRSRKASRRSR